VQHKYDAVRGALQSAGLAVTDQEWPRAQFAYLDSRENIALEALATRRIVNGKPLEGMSGLAFNSFGGQVVHVLLHHTLTPYYCTILLHHTVAAHDAFYIPLASLLIAVLV
jgi:hypothetical protein